MNATVDYAAMPAAEFRRLLGDLTADEFRAAACVRELFEWSGRNRLCGRCGAAMRPHDDPRERAFVCPACGFVAYPAIAPAVIALVTKGDRALMQRNAHYRAAHWSLVAGFVEPGENFEEAVRREAREEAGVELADLRYVGSQAWPFPSNVMVGFRAEWAGGELRPDGEEILENGWFARDALPVLPPPGSIARTLIDGWRAESCALESGGGGR